MVVDPRFLEKHGGRKGMSDAELGQALAAAGRENSGGPSWFEAWAHAQWVKRVVLAILALVIIVAVMAAFVSPSQWQRLKWKVFGRPEQPQSQPAP